MVKLKQAKHKRGRVYWGNDHDITELNMTKDCADFDRNFLRYLRISIE